MTALHGRIEVVVQGKDQPGQTPLHRLHAVFHVFSNKKYLDSPLSKEWPEGMVEKINAL